MFKVKDMRCVVIQKHNDCPGIIFYTKDLNKIIFCPLCAGDLRLE